MADAIMLGNGEGVSSWPDGSSNRRNASQSDSALQPILRTNVLNGHHVVEFGTDASPWGLGGWISVNNKTQFHFSGKLAGGYCCVRCGHRSL